MASLVGNVESLRTVTQGIRAAVADGERQDGVRRESLEGGGLR